MRSIAVGIAGGSGSGKSTLVEALASREPDIFALIQLDDYFKTQSDVPTVDGRRNQDHPDALDFERFVHDLRELKSGRSVAVMTRNHKFNPGYALTKEKTRLEIRPKPIILVEGFLVLHDKRVRALLDKSIWLDAPSEMRWDRRMARKPRVTTDFSSEPRHHRRVDRIDTHP